MEKLFKTIDEQIEYLKDNKKIIVKEEQKCVFEERSYSSLINPYKEFFSYGKNDNGKFIYKNEVDFEEILKIIKIDEEFSAMLYTYIGVFEKKFKTVLFNEICSKYLEGDTIDPTCTSYVNEIELFLNDEKVENLPRFCKNYLVKLSKNGYAEDIYDIEKKKNLLIRLINIGTGKKGEGILIEKSNLLIEHYLKMQNIAPLWIVPNALTLGELNILFSMLDSMTQKKIIFSFYNDVSFEKISLDKILKFSGIVELIRRMRNVVNHYEPIFPFLVTELRQQKKIENSQVYAVLKFLETNYLNSSLSKNKIKSIEYERNNFNLKLFKIIEMMREFIGK